MDWARLEWQGRAFLIAAEQGLGGWVAFAVEIIDQEWHTRTIGKYEHESRAEALGAAAGELIDYTERAEQHDTEHEGRFPHWYERGPVGDRQNGRDGDGGGVLAIA